MLTIMKTSKPALLLIGVILLSFLSLGLLPAQQAAADYRAEPSAAAPVEVNSFGQAVFAPGLLFFPAYTGCGGEIAPPVNPEKEQKVVELTNAVRLENGLPPLKRVVELDRSARYYATDMDVDDYFSEDHETLDRDSSGKLSFVCKMRDRISVYYPNWISLAENIAAGYVTPEEVMNAWMGSAGHKANLLSTSNWEIGAGYYEGSGHYRRYWVQNFGRRSQVYPLVIDGEAAKTGRCEVSVYIYGSWDEMRLRNDSEAWTDWRPFQSSFRWDLGYGEGERTVTAEMRRQDQSAAGSDSIDLAPTSPGALDGVPERLTFFYSIPDQKLYPPSYAVTPVNANCAVPLSWSVSKDGDIFSVTPAGGTTPASFSVSPYQFVTDTAAEYEGSATITVTAPAGLDISPRTIRLELRVIDTPIQELFLPVVKK